MPELDWGRDEVFMILYLISYVYFIKKSKEISKNNQKKYLRKINNDYINQVPSAKILYNYSKTSSSKSASNSYNDQPSA